jgi:hypothetical protein
MTDYAVLYENVTGRVLGAWERTTSDNIATCLAEGHLTVDSVDVVDGLGTGDRTDIAAILLTNPTAIDPAAPLNTYEVDDHDSPTDVVERTDGDRDPYYPYSE